MTHHAAFEPIRRHTIASLNVELQEYRHRVTGARHFHLAADDDNNVFLVAFMTVPQDSTGVAHILEHTALCGSERYPVRDPFFMMSRRSLNTFMNAFTSSDWTAYPFASQNKKDFNNLLGVYLDAAFFPLLHELDFAQEGHRVEFADPADPDSPLVYKGVVFNEMKGAMSSPTRRLAQDLQSALFPNITYHYNSGGEPAEIPNLTHEQLREFHARHYHPSNAVFMTYGDIPAREHQTHFEERALSRFQRLDVDFSVPDEPPFAAPIRISGRYALDEDPAHKTHIVLGWVLGSIDDPRAVLEAQILSDVLLDNSSSPLRQALETSDLGNAPSPLCGLDDDARQMTFGAGVEGSDPEHADAVEKLVLGVIGEVAENGVPQDMLDSVLHQIELGQREITGDGYPYGLSLILEALTPALHGGDPAAALDQDALLAELREDIKDPAFIKGLARRLLLDNAHRALMVMEPDRDLNARAEAAEAERLAALRAGLDEAERRRINERAEALEQRQTAVDDPEILPRVTLADVPAELKIASGESRRVAGMDSAWYAAGTNGIVYQQLVVDLPQLDDEMLDTLPLYALCLTEVGVNGHDYLTMQARQAAVTGGLSAGYLARGAVDDADRLRGVFTLSGKALVRNRRVLTELMQQTFCEARFDETGRLRELIAQWRAAREQRVTGSGHLLALNAAGQRLSAQLALSHRWDGLGGLKRLQELDDALRRNDAGAASALTERLLALGERLRRAPRRLLVVAEGEQHAELASLADEIWSRLPAGVDAAPFGYARPTATDGGKPQGFSTSTQVNFCAKALPAVAPDHPDAPALQVLGNFLRNGYLHRALREKGGAYGGGASYHGDSATFRFFSYRDPRFDDTFADFDASLDWLQSANHDPRALEEAVLGVIAAIDRPGSPAGEAITAFYAELFGRSPAYRRRFRQRVLDVTLDDLKRVAAAYLGREHPGELAAISNADLLQRHAGWSTRPV